MSEKQIELDYSSSTKINENSADEFVHKEGGFGWVIGK